jgi:hypothetical protein
MSSLFVDYREVCPSLELLSYNFMKIRQEYLDNKDKLEYKDFTKQQDICIEENQKGYPITIMNYLKAENRDPSKNGWHMAAIFGHNIVNPANGPYLPTLIQTLRKIGSVSVCGINILDPGISLDWHNDDDYYTGTPTLRTLWGLDVPEEEGKASVFQMKNTETGEVETREFKNNKIYAFWPKTTHRVENNLTKSRAVLAVDVFVSKELVPL